MSERADASRRMVDAIREILGLDPLYSADETPYVPHVYPDEPTTLGFLQWELDRVPLNRSGRFIPRSEGFGWFSRARREGRGRGTLRKP